MAAIAVVWLLLVGGTLLARPLLPVDETRYVGVAWEMWARGDFLVPYLNGQAYSHKPPLLFWAMHAGWLLGGVTETWARLVSPLFALGTLAATAALGRRLWPQRPAVARAAPWILLGCLLYALFTALTMFDSAVSFFVTAGLLAIVQVARTGAPAGWLGLGVALGGGLLAKGPVVLLFTLPAALAAPWWADGPRSWRRWYAGLAGAVVLGALIALAWAVPAGLRGGEAYRTAILWSQTTSRLTESAAHGHPVWWYLVVLPPSLLPWVIWRPLGRALLALRRVPADPGTRLLAAWIAPALLGLSVISGKQPHYLLPLMPALALLGARALAAGPRPRGRWEGALVPGLVLAVGLLLLAAPWMPAARAWSGTALTLGGLAVVGVGLAVLLLGPADLLVMALVAPALVLIAHLGIVPATRGGLDVSQVAPLIRRWQAAGPVGHVGAYHGQFHFYGRLVQPLEIVQAGAERDWLARHPGGRLIAYRRRSRPVPAGVEHVQPYRNRTLVVLGQAALEAGLR